MSPMNKVLITLRFYALGTMLISVADMFGVSISCASKTIRDVSYVIAELSSIFIQIPVHNIKDTKMKMYEIARFPLVFGAIDCTHVRIQSPGGHDSEMFRNRKGYFSLNVQALVNSELQFMDIVARCPGSAHDSHIFRNSRLFARLESGEFQKMAILGDSGYALKPYLLTSISNPVGRIQMLYNESQIRTRNVVERSFGVWKRRFPVLSLGLRLQLKTVQAIIVATAVLHNICREMKEDLPNDNFELTEPHNETEDIIEVEYNDDGRDQDSTMRDMLLNNYFARLVTD
ncbi:putative nuclease HARBI1 [Acyrthosiphon pisum]|uniref:DDE Tnp4 domain-containing protein n=1 Tax=Acyrthosiphon pisum TaxID=7029 RepID=A0A8R2H8Q0_ACYPI|nr:putative nuclease HARBI1 [Acyrthosiphon pisum]